ncbi:dihydrolipoyl dehydrogenase [Prosthecochloris sp. CIB 2401]|uniref:dihydrolipoyl dehydrogenase n=1 Tax=Prosthecochloris sp. CIB 2401 TaxID=1868325 RepID=UPI00080ABBCC|nr:dihydrolipoyl dehydrogenase [Prosthecochloris sp. CIB 2401]ANT64539.1 Dihydrolipoyl dehydrogenase [Prosthecochloris sp. CIB 2401]
MKEPRSSHSFDYDLIVIGSGPGGFDAAMHASKSGLRTAIVEQGALGGVCVNWGCIPTKALLRSAEVIRLVSESTQFGLTAGETQVDPAQVVKRSRKVVLLSSKGVESSLKKQGVDIIRGHATFTSPNSLQVTSDNSEPRTLTALHTIIATGSRPRHIPVMPPDGQRIITSREALVLKEAPGTMVVAGGGAIGLEMAWYYNALGTHVTIVEMMERILPLEDADISRALEASLRKAGIDLCTGAAISSAEINDESVSVSVNMHDGTPLQLEGDILLVAAGVTPNSEGLNLEELGIGLDRGFITTDGHCRTGVPGIYAIGDVRGGMLLAHKASAEARIAVETILGKVTSPVDSTKIPRCVYAEPAVACVGMTEEEAASNGRDLTIGRSLFSASGKASAYGVREGFVKLVFDRTSQVLLGAHLIGHGAVELIGELSLARHLEVTASQIASVIHAHPTLSETVREAAEDALCQH